MKQLHVSLPLGQHLVIQERQAPVEAHRAKSEQNSGSFSDSGPLLLLLSQSLKSGTTSRLRPRQVLCTPKATLLSAPAAATYTASRSQQRKPRNEQVICGVAHVTVWQSCRLISPHVRDLFPPTLESDAP